MELEYQYLVAKLQQALARDDRVSALDIKITVTSGRIHLTGCVPTTERRSAVDAVVSEVLPGVPVKNELTLLELSDRGEHERIDD
jgi:osmotically-inducible protein OsmY